MSLEKTTILTDQPGHGCKVCVTGAGGFIASWLVKRLLERGYTVRGTVRQPSDAKNEHLRLLEGASDRLELVRADVLDYDSLKAAFTGCDGVFHTASPVTDDLEKMIEPSMKGTKNVMYAASDSGVKRIIFTSTIGTIYLNPNRNHDEPVDETCWSDLEFCKKTKNWYCYAKTIAEQGAWEVAKERELDLIVINPVLVLGPLLHPSINASTNHVTKYLTGSAKTYVNAAQAYVHVKDVAEAHVKVYESPQAHGRYICAEGTTLHRGELCRLLVKLFPEYPITNKCRDEKNPPQKAYKFTNQKIKELGMEFTPVNQCIYETVISLQEKGLIPILSKDLSTYSLNYEPLKILQTQTVL